jgi:hypothetical protein
LVLAHWLRQETTMQLKMDGAAAAHGLLDVCLQPVA